MNVNTSSNLPAAAAQDLLVGKCLTNNDLSRLATHVQLEGDASSAEARSQPKSITTCLPDQMEVASDGEEISPDREDQLLESGAEDEILGDDGVVQSVEGWSQVRVPMGTGSAERTIANPSLEDIQNNPFEPPEKLLAGGTTDTQCETPGSMTPVSPID